MFCRILKKDSPDFIPKYLNYYDNLTNLNEAELYLLEISFEDFSEFDLLTSIFGEFSLIWSFNSSKLKIIISLIDFQKHYSDFYSRRIEAAKILAFINNVISDYFAYLNKTIQIGGKEFFCNMKYIFGILNVTPDSFSDGGKYLDVNNAINYAMDMYNSGVDIIDIGGESSRPGSNDITVEEELKRILPVVKEIKKTIPEMIVSIDTKKSKVAEVLLDNGADLINDISGLTYDPDLAEIISKYDCPVIIMHMKGIPATMQMNPAYDDLMGEIFSFMSHQIDFSKSKGINKIIIDPGVGFGKKVEDNYQIIKKLDEFKSFGYPIMAGVSRKSFIGNSLNLASGDRDNATIVAETLSMVNGACFIRTHNIKNAIEAKKLLNIYNKVN